MQLNEKLFPFIRLSKYQTIHLTIPCVIRISRPGRTQPLHVEVNCCYDVFRYEYPNHERLVKAVLEIMGNGGCDNKVWFV